MEAAVENELTQAFAPEGAEGTAAVLDALVAQPVAHAVGDARRDAPHPRIAVAALHAPAGRRVPALELPDEGGDVVRIVLQIRVHRDDPGAAGRLESGVGGGGLAGVGL